VSKNQKNMQPYWRPNFVNASKLPDIKVVRTDFVINFISISISLILVYIVLQSEYRAAALRGTIDDMRKQVLISEPDDALNLKLSDSFRTATNHIIEVQKFFDSPVLAHEFLKGLTLLKPNGLIFSAFSVSEAIKKDGSNSFVEYSINMSGEVKDPVVLDNFKDALSKSSLVGESGYDFQINESILSRDAETGIFPYRLSIIMSKPKAKAPAKAEGGQG